VAFWDAPTFADGDPERIKPWCQVSTGTEMDEKGELQALDAETWQKRRDRLMELGGPPGAWARSEN